MKSYPILLAAALALALAACGSADQAESSPATAGVEPTPAASAAVSPGKKPPAASPAPTAAAQSPAPETTPEPTATGEPEETRPVATPAPEPSQEPQELRTERLADETVLAAYREAAEAYSWFAGYGESGLMLDFQDMEERPDLTFYRVTRPGLRTMDELRAYLKSLFSDEIVDPLLAETPGTPHFIETAEGLYALPAGRGSDVTKGAVALAVIWPEEESPVSCTVQARVELLAQAGEGELVPAGEAVYEFPYQKVGDKWVFTQFESIF